MRIRDPKTTALIFASGKMVCTGAKSEEDSRMAARKVGTGFTMHACRCDWPYHSWLDKSSCMHGYAGVPVSMSAMHGREEASLPTHSVWFASPVSFQYAKIVTKLAPPCIPCG